MASKDLSAFDANGSLARMRERTDATREAEAVKVFSTANINTVLSGASAKGQSAAIFSPSIPMDLSATPTAKAVKSMLENAGFLVEWKITRPTPDSEPHTVLRVSWGVDAKASGITASQS